MNPDLDDPRLTAFALGELEGEECARIEAFLAENEPARWFVAELRVTAALLNEGLCGEVSPGLDDARREAIFAQEIDAAPPLRLHLDDAPERTDIYRVITHPGFEARRYRAQLLAIAATVAIVAAGLTLLFSSMYHSHGGSGQVAASAPNSPPLVMPQGDGGGEKLTVPGDGMASRPPRDLIGSAPGEQDGSSQPFGISSAISVAPIRVPATGESGGGGYALTIENPFFEAGRNPLSGFSFHVGHSSYAAVGHAIGQKKLPGKDDVRIEQLVNFFPYDYAVPKDGETFAAHIEVAACPWQRQHRLVRIGLKARELAQAQSVAEDLRIRVEFNPAQVTAYRLIGYDRRLLTKDESGDRIKHNHVDAGQAVTALYEVIPTGAAAATGEEPLKYQKPAELTAAAQSRELLTVQLRYLDPAGPVKSQSFAAVDPGAAAPEASADFQFAAAVAGFGLVLRDSPHKAEATYDIVLSLAQSGIRGDVLGERGRFIELVQQAKRL
jgi:hypothetical protein